MDIFNGEFLGNSLEAWMTALGIALVSFLGLLVLRRLMKGRLLRWIRKSKNDVDDFLIPLVEKTHWIALLGLGVYLGIDYQISLSPEIQLWFGRALLVILVLQIGFWASGMINYYVTREVKERLEEDDGDDATTLDALGLVGQIVLWIILGLILLDNFDVEISSLVTSLGIGGIAVALAMQNILGDLFASMSIALDRPFVIGDYVVVDEFEGDVRDIGLKSTRVRSLSGEELIFSNTDMLSSRIRNYKRLEKRRISFNFGVVYGTDVEHLRKIPAIVEEIIAPLEKAEFEMAHFKSLGDYSLDYTVVYHVLVQEYATYLDLQHQINLALYEKFAELEIEFAYPTQTVVMAR